MNDRKRDNYDRASCEHYSFAVLHERFIAKQRSSRIVISHNIFCLNYEVFQSTPLRNSIHTQQTE